MRDRSRPPDNAYAQDLRREISARAADPYAVRHEGERDEPGTTRAGRYSRPDGIEVLRRENGTGEGADEEQLGVTDDELDELEDDAEGG